MSGKRGSRGKSNKNCVLIKVRDDVQLQHTLDLSNVVGDKPLINEVMERIMARLEEEHRKELLATAVRWSRGQFPTDCMIYDCMGDNEFDDEDYSDMALAALCSGKAKLKSLNKKLFKREHRGEKHSKGKKRYSRTEDMDDYWNNRHTMYPEDDFDNEDNVEDPYKCIKFYTDIENEMSVQEFYSLKDFNDFCQEKGYHVGCVDYNNLVNMTVVHCCLDPISKEYGENDVITDNSYGALYWSVSDDMTKQASISSNDVTNFQ